MKSSATRHSVCQYTLLNPTAPNRHLMFTCCSYAFRAELYLADLSYTVHTAYGNHVSAFAFLVCFRCVAMTVPGVQVIEGKATGLNFTLASLSDQSVSHTTTLSTTASPAPVTNSSDSHANSSVPSETTTVTDVLLTSFAPQPQQPQKFRHHHNSDMELFLQKCSMKYPSITRLYSIGKSVQGRLLWVMEISDNPGEHEQGVCGRLFTEYKYVFLERQPSVRSTLYIDMIQPYF